MSHPSSGGEPAPYDVTLCRGVAAQAQCRFAMPTDAELVSAIRAAVDRSGWPEFVRAAVGGPLLHHHAFRIAVAACPNGCSRPHVADVGFIRACTPELDPTLCTRCGLCVRVCPDDAISLDRLGPVFDREQCMECGLCVAKCREQALACRTMGYRIVLGGKLGRHPRLATEIPEVFTVEQGGAVVEVCLALYMRHYARGVRFGSLVERLGDELAEELDSL